MKTLGQKLGLRSGQRLILLAAPEPAPELDLQGAELKTTLADELDVILSFVTQAAGLDAGFERWKMHVARDGRLWICWPKKGRLVSDLNIKEVIRIGYEHGMVESNAISVNDAWSALKFTHPKAGKVYNNSYGTLDESKVRYYRDK